jgi:hypothetical protein
MSETVWVLVELYPDAGPEITLYVSRDAAYRDLAGRARGSDSGEFPDDDDRTDREVAEAFLALWSGDIELHEETVHR